MTSSLKKGLCCPQPQHSEKVTFNRLLFQRACHSRRSHTSPYQTCNNQCSAKSVENQKSPTSESDCAESEKFHNPTLMRQTDRFITVAAKGEGGYVLTPFYMFVCVQDISKHGGQVGFVTRTNWLDFGEDLDPATGILKVILHHWETGLNWYIARYLKKLWTDSDETWWTVCVCDKDELIRF